MQRTLLGLLATAAALGAAPEAWAASDYFLKIDGIEGEAASTIEIQSWSWGASNPGAVASSNGVVSPRDAASGQASGRRQHGPVTVQASQNTQSLRESPTRASTGATAKVNVQDISVMRMADFATVDSMDQVQAFTLDFDKASPVLAKVCSGKHFTSVQIQARGEVYQIEDPVAFTCSAPAAGQRDSMPNRLSMNVTTPRQTQGATFGDRCISGQCPAEMVAVTITGQMKHTKTGHVTLMK